MCFIEHFNTTRDYILQLSVALRAIIVQILIDHTSDVCDTACEA
jgi:hypothetical protein